MINKTLVFLFVLCNCLYSEEIQDSLYVKHSDSKAPIIISTFPFLNNDPVVVFAISSFLLMLHNKEDSLSINKSDPNTAMLLSSLPLLNIVSDNEIPYLPSLGQMYNQKYFKSFMLTTLKTYWLSEYHKSKNNDLKDRNRSLWWLLILILYSMGDAYVDAHLAQIPEKININLNDNHNGEKK
jgi:hypothetical protein